MSDERDEEQTEDATGKRKVRPCCTAGERHSWWGNWRYVYDAFEHQRAFSEDNEGTGTYTVRRRNKPAAYFANEPRPDYDYLCDRGHWTTNHREGAEIVSEREAANLVRRLNAGLPIHRDRWLGIGAMVLVAAEVAQAVRAIWPDTSEITVEVINTMP